MATEMATIEAAKVKAKKPFRIPPEVAEAWTPRRPMPILEWVEQNIYFSAKVSAHVGFWSREIFPYLDEILETLADPRYQRVVAGMGTQLGKTATGGAFTCWIADQNPIPMMVSCPDEKSAEEHQKTKLVPMISTVDSLRGKLAPERKRNKQRVDLGSQVIYYSWSGARWSVSGRSAAVVHVTEVNLHSRATSKEGDPVQMAEDRTKAFSPERTKIYIEGKCTERGSCRVTENYEQSDQRHFHLPCPHCGEYQWLQFGSVATDYGLKWKTDDRGELIPSSVYYECRYCHLEIREQHRPLMLIKGKWVKKGQHVTRAGWIAGVPERQNGIAGFQLSSMYSPVIPWASFVAEFLRCKRESTSALKNFVQGWLAEPWETKKRNVDADQIVSHRDTYEIGYVPDEVIDLVATVDVQHTELVYVVRAWGYYGNSWLIRYGRNVTSWTDLVSILSANYPGVDGEEHRIRWCLIDATDGNKAVEVYNFCAKNRAICIPVRGIKQYGQSSLMRAKDNGIPQLGLALWEVDAGHAFDQLYDHRMSITRGDRGYWSLPTNIGRDYIDSLAGWHRKAEPTPDDPDRKRWRSKNKENEHYGDCEKMQEAAAFHFGYGFREPPGARPAAGRHRSMASGPGGWR